MQNLSLKLAADPSAAGTFTGLASTPDLDRSRDVIPPSAWAATLDAWAARGGRIPLLYLHDQREPVGAITSARATAHGLEVEGAIAVNTPTGAIVYELAKLGSLSLSIGFVVPEGGAVRDPRTGVRTIHVVDLYEISLVPVADNPAAVVQSVKQFRECASIREFEAAAREALGLSARQAKTLAAVGWPALRRDGAEPRREDAPPSAAPTGPSNVEIRRALGLS
ncbi:HK97 family phage prohead protease [Frateuria soli]|uniref:HK97 family phage prohead protease n=1 Tax=Frateuria soli TaxID=1542730 RepID=UPI001E338FAA|nr:HK97 family phage prohead protease [Frateuria soli]UGB39724.1 HK97 family phage prohead protease [Frateuria soli]